MIAKPTAFAKSINFYAKIMMLSVLTLKRKKTANPCKFFQELQELKRIGKI